MKKILLLSIILLQSLIFKSLCATNNSLENPYKIVERKSPEKHFTVNKENLLKIFDLEPKNAIVEIEIPYLDMTEKFQLEKLDIRGEDNLGMTITTDGDYFTTKIYNGLTYNINDLNNINMGTMTIYPNNVYINLRVNGEEIRIEKDFNSKFTQISKNDINDKNTEDFKNIKDIIAKIDKLKNEKTLTKSDISAMKEVKDFDKQKQKESQQTIKEFKNDELLSPAPAPPPPPITCAPIVYTRCQVILVNYMISYETYLKWQTPTFIIENGKLTLKEGAITKDYNQTRVNQVTQKLTNYFAQVVNIFAQEGINVQLGRIIVETNPLEYYQKDFSPEQGNLNSSNSEVDYNIKSFKNQYLRGNREWKGWLSPFSEADDGAFKDIPKDKSDFYNGGQYIGIDYWSCGRLNTAGVTWGLQGLLSIFQDRISTVADNDSNFIFIRDGNTGTIDFTKLGNSDFFSTTPFVRIAPRDGATHYGQSLMQFYDGFWFYIGDIVPATTNENPAMSWKEFMKNENARADIIKYSSQNFRSNNDFNGNNFTGWSMNRLSYTIDPGTFNHNNYLPMLVAPKDISDDNLLNLPNPSSYSSTLFGNVDPFVYYYDLSKKMPLSSQNIKVNGFDEVGAHLQSLGVSYPLISIPTMIYGQPNNTKFVNIPDPRGIIPLLGNMWYHTYDLENVNTKYFDVLTNNGDWKNGDAINYKQYPMHKIIYDGDEINTDTVLQWNYQDVQELYGTTGQFGNSNHLLYNIDKWNVWMLVHHIAIKLGPRYFTTTRNQNTILAPLARNYNYNADDYDYIGGTPHISERPPSEKNVPMETSWLRHWFQTYLAPSFNSNTSNPGNGYDIALGITATLAEGASVFVPGRIAFASGSAQKGTGDSYFWYGSTIWYDGGIEGKYGDRVELDNSATMTTTWAVLLIYLAATAIYDGISFGWSREDLVPPIRSYTHPYIYRRHIASDNTSGDNYDEEEFFKDESVHGGDLKIGWQNWDARYSAYDLQLVPNMCPVDFVSFSKGFDKKTGDLIRLNLMSENVNGHGLNTNNCDCADPNCQKTDGVIRGKPNPYATISLWNKKNIYAPALEHQFYGDTVFARNNVLIADYPNIGLGQNFLLDENMTIIKNSALTTEEEVNNSDIFTNLDDWYGKQMKVQSRYEGLDRVAGSRFNNNSYSWRFNNTLLTNANGDFPFQNLVGNLLNNSRARILIPTSNDSLMRIYPVTLRLTDTAGCVSNTAVKYMRVYPRKELPVKNSFIEKISPSSGALYTKYIPFGFSIGAFGLSFPTYSTEIVNGRIKYDQFNLNTKNLYGTRLFGMKNWEFIGPWSTGEGPSEASTYTAGYYNRGMKPWSPSRLSNTGWGIGNLSESLDPMYSGKAVLNQHPVLGRFAYQNSRFNSQQLGPFSYTAFQYASYVDNWSNYKSLFYFPIRITEKQALEQYSVGDASLADARFDKTYNYGLGANDGGGVFFKNENRPMYYAYAKRGEKPWNNWAFNIYDYYRPNQDLSYAIYENNDDETFTIGNIGGGRLPSNAKSPIKYFFGRNRFFATNQIIDLGARPTYNDEWESDHSNTLLGEGPEKWAHPSSWFHERDYIWISRTRANRVFPGLFSNGGEWYRIRPIIKTPPFNINYYDPITRISNTFNILSLSYIWGTNDINYDNEQSINNDYNNETRKRNYKAADYLNSEFSGLQSMPEWASLTNFRKGTSDTARSPLYFNDDSQNNYLKFKLSYSYFAIPDTGIVYYYAATGSPYIKWNTSIRQGQNTGGGTIEIWGKGVTENGVIKKRLLFQRNLKEMSSYKGKTNFKFKRFGDPREAFEPIGGIYKLTSNFGISGIDYNPDIGFIRPGYVLMPTIDYDSVPTPIGTVAWFPQYPKNVYTGEIEPLKIYHKPMAEYLQSPINNKYYKNTVDWSDINLDIRDLDDCKSLQFDIVHQNPSTASGSHSSLILGSMEIETGRNLPLPLCEGGDPIIEFISDVNDTLPLNPNIDAENRVAPWRVSSPIPNNVAICFVNLIKPDGSREPLRTFYTGQAYNIADNQIKTTSSPGTFVGPILATGTIQTAPGNNYQIEATFVNTNTVNINGNIYNETEPQQITVTASAYQQRLPKRKPRFYPDSAFNFDGNFSLIANFNNFTNTKSNIESFILQKATINTSGTGESDTTWQNVGSTLTYTNCTPAMAANVKYYNFSTPCTYKFNINSLPNTTTPLPNGVYTYRLRYTGKLDNPSIEFTEAINVVICRTCDAPIGNVDLYVKASDSLDAGNQVPIIGISSFNYGDYNLYAEIKPSKEGELNNIKFIDVYEAYQGPNSQTYSPSTFIKRLNINAPYNAFIFIDSLRNKTTGGYHYILRCFTNNASYPVAISNKVDVKVPKRPCTPFPDMEAFTDILNFDLKTSCGLTKYKVLLYKLENSTISLFDTIGGSYTETLYANNEYLELTKVKRLGVNSTAIARFQNDEIPDGTIRFTQQEILNKMFSRLVNPRPTTLNNWYRVDVICTSCTSDTEKTKSIYYYFNN